MGFMMQIRPEVMEHLLSAYGLERKADRELRNYVEIILPLLADHVLREANHYIRILSDRQDDPVPSPYQFK